MMKPAIRCLACSAALLMVAGCGKGDRSAKGAKSESQAVARVGKTVITHKDLEEAFRSLPQYQQGQYSGTFGQRRLLDELVKRHVIVQTATDLGLDRVPEVQRQIEDYRARLLTQEFARNLVESLPQPTEADLRSYYDKHPQEFVVPARVNASWIKCATRKDAEAARRRIVERGENFGDVAARVTIDTATKRDRGLLGYFNLTGIVRDIGSERPEFNAKAFALEVNQVGPVFEWDGGWAFIKVHEKTSDRQQPYEMVREQILSRLRPSYSDAMLNEELVRLRRKLDVKVFMDAGKDLEDKSADELMRLATEAPNPNDKIEYYRALLHKYPHYERADEAQFMVGFVYSEELQDFEAAKAEYQKVIQTFPESDIRQSAEYMLQNMGHGKLPGFEPGAEPGTDVPGREPATAAPKQPGAGGL